MNSVSAVGQIAAERDRVLPPSGTKGVSAQPHHHSTVQLGLCPIRFVPILCIYKVHAHISVPTEVLDSTFMAVTCRIVSHSCLNIYTRVYNAITKYSSMLSHESYNVSTACIEITVYIGKH